MEHQEKSFSRLNFKCLYLNKRSTLTNILFLIILFFSMYVLKRFCNPLKFLLLLNLEENYRMITFWGYQDIVEVLQVYRQTYEIQRSVRHSLITFPIQCYKHVICFLILEFIAICFQTIYF